MTESRLLAAAVGVLSAALMSTELVLTRIFSVVIWYHFAFFAISVALFGSAVAALVVHLRQDDLAPERTRHYLTVGSVALAVVILAADLVLLNATPDWFWPGSVFTMLTGKLLALFLLAAAPFFTGGFVLALVMTRFARSMHVVYAADLMGAGAACVLVVPVLAWVGGPRALVVSALLAALAGVAFAMSADDGKTSGRGLRLLAGGTVVAVAVFGVVEPSFGWLRVRIAKGMDLVEARVEFNEWNSFSMVTVSPNTSFRGWGLSPEYEGPIPDQKTLVIDMNAMTSLTRFSGSFDEVRYARHDLSAIVYRVAPDPGNVAVIGAGGGKDVLAALLAGADHVAAVEVNPLIVETVMLDRYRDYTGGLYARPDVTPIVEDGRAFARRTSDRFDVLLLSMVDTSAATAAGAYTLTENSLYTVEAFHDFLDRLEPDGVFTVSSVTMPGLAVGARLAAIARAALRARGDDPTRSVAVLATPWLRRQDAILFDLLVKPGGFDPDEVTSLATAATELGFRAVYLPGGGGEAFDPESTMVRFILGEADEARYQAHLESWPLDVSPPHDARPFFFYQNRLRDLVPAMLSTEPTHLFGNGLVVVAKVTGVAFILVLGFLLFPLVLGRRQIRAGRGSALVDLAYVSCLGLGFLFVEIALLQRFTLYLGQPVYSLAVVLFVLLVGGGLGSRLLARGDPAALRRRIPRVAAAIVAYALVLVLSVDPIARATGGLPELARVAVAVAVLLPIGLMLGAPLPAGLRVVGERAGTRIPWLWSVNSAMSVLASILATLVSLHAGVFATLMVGAGLYAVIGVLGPRVLDARVT